MGSAPRRAQNIEVLFLSTFYMFYGVFLEEPTSIWPRRTILDRRVISVCDLILPTITDDLI